VIISKEAIHTFETRKCECTHRILRKEFESGGVAHESFVSESKIPRVACMLALVSIEYEFLPRLSWSLLTILQGTQACRPGFNPVRKLSWIQFLYSPRGISHSTVLHDTSIDLVSNRKEKSNQKENLSWVLIQFLHSQIERNQRYLWT
jgi:hypothetical protein